MDKKTQARPIRIRIAASAETHDCGDGTTEIIINSPDFGKAIIAPLSMSYVEYCKQSEKVIADAEQRAKEIIATAERKAQEKIDRAHEQARARIAQAKQRAIDACTNAIESRAHEQARARIAQAKQRAIDACTNAIERIGDV